MGKFIMKKFEILFLIGAFMTVASGCMSEIQSRNENIENSRFEKFTDDSCISILHELKEQDEVAADKKERTPVRAQWQTGDMKYDTRDTVYSKTFYEGFGEGKTMDIGLSRVVGK